MIRCEGMLWKRVDVSSRVEDVASIQLNQKLTLKLGVRLRI
jgi:hypothetical protein